MNSLSNYSLYLFFGVLPSIVWLLFYLKRDSNPEPNRMILKVFFCGMLATIPAIAIETVFFEAMRRLDLSALLALSFNVFLGVALTEESLKFWVVKEKVLSDPEFDEPVDAMIYMIIAGLGFAAGENLLILFPLQSPVLTELFQISLLRFLGATFLHALCSAIIGYFIGLSFFRRERRKRLAAIGIAISTLLHGFYNFSIIKIENGLNLLVSFSLLIIAAVFVSYGFQKLKALKK